MQQVRLDVCVSVASLSSVFPVDRKSALLWLLTVLSSFMFQRNSETLLIRNLILSHRLASLRRRRLSITCQAVKPKFHLARHVSTRHVRRVEPMHFGCVELVERHGLDTLVSTRSTRRTCRVVSRRDVTWRAKWNLGFIELLAHAQADRFELQNAP